MRDFRLIYIDGLASFHSDLSLSRCEIICYCNLIFFSTIIVNAKKIGFDFVFFWQFCCSIILFTTSLYIGRTSCMRKRQFSTIQTRFWSLKRSIRSLRLYTNVHVCIQLQLSKRCRMYVVIDERSIKYTLLN